MAKQLKMKHEKLDRISTLRDAILCHVLLFLSTKEAISTSILSTRWRFVFTSLPNLDLDDTLLWLPKPNKHATVRKFFNFVDRLLFFHTTTDLEKLRLKITKDASRLYSWRSAAVTLRGIRQLDLCISDSQESIKLPNVLFTCKTLAVLKLDIDHEVLYVPTEACLPNLKNLHLEYAGCLNDSNQNLISGCTRLEDFFINCEGSNISRFNICNPFLKRLTLIVGNEKLSETYIVIDVPSLVYLKCLGKIAAGYSLQNLNSLVKASIEVSPGKYAIQTSECVSANDFFRGIVNVESLKLHGFTLNLLVRHERLPLFDKLVKLKINSCSYKLREKEFFDLLRSMPNLVKLDFPYEVFYKLSATYLPETVPSCLLYHLKMVKISSFYLLDQLDNFKFFLKNAAVLVKLPIHATCLNKETKLKIAEDLLASPRKSKKCRISVV